MYTQGERQIPSGHSHTEPALPHETTKAVRAGGPVDLRALNRVAVSTMLEGSTSKELKHDRKAEVQHQPAAAVSLGCQTLSRNTEARRSASTEK